MFSVHKGLRGHLGSWFCSRKKQISKEVSFVLITATSEGQTSSQNNFNIPYLDSWSEILVAFFILHEFISSLIQSKHCLQWHKSGSWCGFALLCKDTTVKQEELVSGTSSIDFLTL